MLVTYFHMKLIFLNYHRALWFRVTLLSHFRKFPLLSLPHGDKHTSKLSESSQFDFICLFSSHKQLSVALITILSKPRREVLGSPAQPWASLGEGGWGPIQTHTEAGAASALARRFQAPCEGKGKEGVKPSTHMAPLFTMVGEGGHDGSWGS